MDDRNPYDRNPYAPSRASLTAPSSQPTVSRSDGVTAWRNQKVLVMIPDTQLPPRCVKCNAPADEPTKIRKVYWHHPAIYLVILINIVIYAIVATIVRRRALVGAGLCAAHKKRRRLAILIAWASFIIGVGLLAWATRESAGNGAAFAAAAVAALLAAILAGIIAARVVYAQRIDKSFVWLKGCGAEFLDSLPPLP
jgi:hypothetical protein